MEQKYSDKHPLGENLKMFDFDFTYNSYKIWQSYKVISKGDFEGKIAARVTNINSWEKTQVEIVSNKISEEISSIMTFEILRSGTDRLQLVTIPGLDSMKPSEFNADDYGPRIILAAQRMNYPYNQPYCCNIFTAEGKVSKVTFSYVNPERLLEFEYESDENLEIDNVFYKFRDLFSSK